MIEFLTERIYYLGLILSVIFVRLISLHIRKNGRAVFFVVSALIVIMFQGLRSFSVGTDIVRYIPGFLSIGKNVSLSFTAKYANFEIGYILLNKIIYMLGLRERGFLIVMAIIIQAPIFYTMYKYSESPLLSVFAYFAFGNFLMTFSGLRQSIAMAICFFAYTCIKKKKWIRYYFLIFLAYLFHKSAIIGVIIYPIYHIKNNKSFFPFAICLIALCFLFRNQIFAFASKIYYSEEISTTETGAYTMFIAFLLLYIVSFFLQDGDAEYSGLMNILLIIILIYTLAPVHDYITRMAFPLSLYLTILIPKVVDRVKRRVKEKSIISVLSNILCIACFLWYVGGLETLPFSFL